MKKSLNALRVSMVTLVLLFGCKKTPQVPPVPPVEVTSEFNLVTPSTIWFDGSAEITYTLVNIDSIKINGNKVDPVSGTFRLNNLKSQTSVLFQAWGKKGFFSQRTVVVSVYSQVRTFICSGSGVWQRTENKIKHNGVWSTNPSASCIALIFYPNDSLKLVSTLCGSPSDYSGKYSLAKGDTQMLLDQFSGSDPWDIIGSVTANRLEIERVLTNGDTIKDVYTR